MDKGLAELRVVLLRLDAPRAEEEREVLLRQVAVLAGARGEQALDEVLRDLALVWVDLCVDTCERE